MDDDDLLQHILSDDSSNDIPPSGDNLLQTELNRVCDGGVDTKRVFFFDVQPYDKEQLPPAPEGQIQVPMQLTE